MSAKGFKTRYLKNKNLANTVTFLLYQESIIILIRFDCGVT